MWLPWSKSTNGKYVDLKTFWRDSSLPESSNPCTLLDLLSQGNICALAYKSREHSFDLLLHVRTRTPHCWSQEELHRPFDLNSFGCSQTSLPAPFQGGSVFWSRNMSKWTLHWSWGCEVFLQRFDISNIWFSLYVCVYGIYRSLEELGKKLPNPYPFLSSFLLLESYDSVQFDVHDSVHPINSNSLW